MDAVFDELEAALRASSSTRIQLPSIIFEALSVAAVWLRMGIGIALGLTIGA